MPELITKKCAPSFYRLVRDGDKNVELRLADFSIEVGDWLELKEYDAETRTYSGESVQREVAQVHFLTASMLAAFGMTPEAVAEHGLYLIELGEESDDA